MIISEKEDAKYLYIHSTNKSILESNSQFSIVIKDIIEKVIFDDIRNIDLSFVINKNYTSNSEVSTYEVY